MPSTPVIVILDIGKTNKKLLLFDEWYNVVWEKTDVLPETRDEDGFPCEDLNNLWSWITDVLVTVGKVETFDLRAINFSAYGASFVHVDENGAALTPLYSYLKPYPAELRKRFYDQYGGETGFSLVTASPVLGSLNSGMQLYRLKNEQPERFEKIKYSLHLPQWLSWMMTGRAGSDITSIGCHTNLWNFSLDYYHEWVIHEGIISKLPPIQSSEIAHPCKTRFGDERVSALPTIGAAGIGLHDSSAALIPYLEYFREPFVLISTGTWCISLNPFNADPLTLSELESDCLFYLSFKGKPVKASRLFAGFEHDQQLGRLAEYFQVNKNYFQQVVYDRDVVNQMRSFAEADDFNRPIAGQSHSRFVRRELSSFKSVESAYHRLMMDIVELQVASTRLILSDSVNKIFVDGGFARNPVYMHLLATSFPLLKVCSSHIAQASAAGAAMVIHRYWNKKRMPADMVELKYFEP